MDQMKAMRSFVAVVDEGGFGKAGQRLGLSKALVSKQISALEAHLSCRLLYRTTRRSSLSAAGETYLAHCRAVLEQIDAMEESLAAETERPHGRLRISAPLSFGHLVLAPLIAGFSLENPEVRLEIELNDRFVDLIGEGYDLAIRIGGELPESLIARTIGWADRGFFASPHYIAERGLPETAADLAGHRCLTYDQGGRQRPWRFAGRRLTPRSVLKCNNGDLLRQVALNHGGIVELPAFFVMADLRDGRLRRLDPEAEGAPLPIQAVYPNRAYLPAKVRAFLDHLTACLKEQESVA